MFRLVETRESRRGVYCGEKGLYIGLAPLLERGIDGIYRVRPAAEIETLLAAAYETPPEIARSVAALRRTAGHLQTDNLPLAMIAAVQLELPDIAEDRIEKLARVESLLKANYDPGEARDDPRPLDRER